MDTLFTKIATSISTLAGRPMALILSTVLVILWAVTGPFFHYSDTWQLILNTVSSIITFLMVFLIQNSQNRDAAAMQAKLDEIIRALDKARGEFVGIEHFSDTEIDRLRGIVEEQARGVAGKAGTADDSIRALQARE